MEKENISQNLLDILGDDSELDKSVEDVFTSGSGSDMDKKGDSECRLR